jgi:hypothetical protein
MTTVVPKIHSQRLVYQELLHRTQMIFWAYLWSRVTSVATANQFYIQLTAHRIARYRNFFQYSLLIKRDGDYDRKVPPAKVLTSRLFTCSAPLSARSSTNSVEKSIRWIDRAVGDTPKEYRTRSY